MAGKKQSLIPEEKLAQALVPQDQQPYKLPKGWVWTYLLDGFAKCCDSSRKPVSASERATLKGDIPYYGATGQVGWINDYLTNEELVLIGEDGAPFLDVLKDKAYIINGKAWINNHAHILKSYFGHIGNLYLVHYLNSFDYRGFVNGTTRLKLTQGNMKKIPIPLPPLPEQQRIVSRIESLFTKLDAARDKLQQVLDTQEARRAAILHEAFSGGWGTRDSEEGRVKSEEGDGLAEGTVSVPEGWNRVALGDAYDLKAGKNIKAKEISEKKDALHPYPCYGGNGIRGYVKNSNREGLHPIIGRQGALCGNVNMADGEFYATEHAVVVTDKIPSDAIWTYYYLTYLDLNQYATSTAQPGLAVGNLNKIWIALPPLETQHKVASELIALYQKEDAIKKAAQSALAQIDLLKKAILARAFRGELGTGDPEDPDVLDLLKQCR
ncbi:restriction endonuclease subunit S [Acidaminococcus fermentans]|uniref:restriction endonuclease subunit S n=1 Tax=Acidaminococcus fermentans TaxID=905 RepID=UPI00266D259B|nr:restriction endonuclease subunit S [Acidaminococcus fermentans]